MTTTTQHPPMFSVEAEKSVIGALMARPELLDVARASVDEWMFYRDANRRVYRALVALSERSAPIEPVSVHEQLSAVGDLEHVGGPAYLAELIDWVPVTSEAHLLHHIQIVRRHATRRRVFEQAAAVQEFVRSHADAEPELLQAEVERMMAESMPASVDPSGGFTSVGDHLGAEMERLERIARGEDVVEGIKTGLHAVDSRLLAMQKGDLVVAAGRPSMGKSAWGLCNVAADAAIRQGVRVAHFAIETQKGPNMRRLIASESRVNLWAAQRNRTIRDDEYPRLAQAAGPLNAAKLHLNYTPGLTLDMLRANLRALIRERGPIGLVVVDYLQKMTHPKARNAYEETTAISKGLKQIAGEFDVVMFALAQLSRAVEQRPDKRPSMSDLRESGAIEQDADIIMLLYRPEYYFPTGMPVKNGNSTTTVDVTGKAEIILSKVREGETGTAVCAWEGAYTHFEDLRGYA